MSTSLQQNEPSEPKPTLHKFISQSSNVKLSILVNWSYCKWNDGLYFQSETKNVTCYDRANIVMSNWNTCNASVRKCPKCGTMKNTCKDRNVANSHKGLWHNVKLNPGLRTNKIDENTIDECDKENFALNGDFEINNVQRELNKMKFLFDLSLENDVFKCFIRHLDQQIDRK